MDTKPASLARRFANLRVFNWLDSLNRWWGRIKFLGLVGGGVLAILGGLALKLGPWATGVIAFGAVAVLLGVVAWVKEAEASSARSVAAAPAERAPNPVHVPAYVQALNSPEIHSARELLELAREIRQWLRDFEDRREEAHRAARYVEDYSSIDKLLERSMRSEFQEKFVEKFQLHYGWVSYRHPNSTLEELYDGPRSFSEADRLADAMSWHAQKLLSDTPREEDWDQE